MDAIGGADLRTIEIVAGESAEDHQRDDALAVRRALVDFVAATGGGDRRLVDRALGGEIVQRVQATEPAQALDHVGGDRSLVEGVAPAAGDGAQGLGEQRVEDAVAAAERCAVAQEDAGCDGIVGDLAGRADEVEGDARRHRAAGFRERDRRPQQVGHVAGAVVGGEAEPGVDRARDGDGVGGALVDGGEAALEIPAELGRGRGPAGAVEGDRQSAGRGIEDEAVAADAGHVRLRHAQQRAGGDRRVDGVAAGAQHLDGRQGGERVGGRRHALDAEGGRTRRLVEVAHHRGIASHAGAVPGRRQPARASSQGVVCRPDQSSRRSGTGVRGRGCWRAGGGGPSPAPGRSPGGRGRARDRAGRRARSRRGCRPG
jgi:hypothetical protein